MFLSFCFAFCKLVYYSIFFNKDLVSQLMLENIALRQQVVALNRVRKRPRLRNFDRLFWVWLKKVFPSWKKSLLIVQPATVVSWHRKGFKIFWKWKSRHKNIGRPLIHSEIRRLIKQMVAENPGWRAPRIHGELLKLGFNVCERSISRYLPRRKPDPDKVKQWKAFLSNHKDVICAMDFFTVPTIFFRNLYVFFIIEHGTRKIKHFNVTFNPTALFVQQQFREAFQDGETPKFMIHDRDTIFSKAVVNTMENMGIKSVRTSFRSPWQNGIAERFVGNVRRELLKFIIPLSANHLRRLMKEYSDYYPYVSG